MKVVKEEIKALADRLCINLDEKNLTLAQSELQYWLDAFSELDDIKVDQLQPTYFAPNATNHILREDVPQSANREEILHTSQNVEKDFIVVK